MTETPAPGNPHTLIDTIAAPNRLRRHTYGRRLNRLNRLKRRVPALRGVFFVEANRGLGGGEMVALERYHLRLSREVVAALEALSRKVAFRENRPVTWADLVRRGCQLVIEAEGDRPVPTTLPITPTN